jgi:hypothetical protein
MGSKGLELVNTYPKVLPDNILNEIVTKSMPMGAKEGDFTSNTVGVSAFSGYIFSMPSDSGRSNIASLIAVFSDLEYDSNVIKKVFTFTVTELKKNNIIDTDTIIKIMPKLYEGLSEGHLKIKVSSVVTLECDIRKESKDKDEEALNSFGQDFWK